MTILVTISRPHERSISDGLLHPREHHPPVEVPQVLDVAEHLADPAFPRREFSILAKVKLTLVTRLWGRYQLHRGLQLPAPLTRQCTARLIYEMSPQKHVSLLFGKGWSWVIARNGPEGHNWPGEPNCQYDPQEATSPKSGLVTDHSATTPVVKLIKIKEEDGDWRSCACFGKLCHIFGLNMYTASIQLFGYIAYSYMAFFGLILTTNLCLFWPNFDFLIFQDQVWTR